MYTVGQNPYTVIRLRNRWLSVIYGTGYTAYRGYGVYTVIRFGPTLLFCVGPLFIFVSFLNYKYNTMIVVGTEISSGGRARASKRVAMQACTVDRFPVPYRNRTIYTV